MAFDLKQTVQKKQASPPMRSYMWRVVLPALTHAVAGVTHGDGTNKADALEPNINYEISSRINTITTPFISIETEKALDANTFWYFAKSNDIGTISMDVHEYEDGMSLEYFQSWLGLMINSNGSYNPPAIYKKDIIVYRLAASGEDLVKYTYKNYFVSGIGDVTNEYDNTDIVRYPIVLTGDSVEIERDVLANLGVKPNEAEILAQTLNFSRSLPDLDEVIENALFS